MGEPKSTVVSREELFEQVWSTPISSLAKSYGMSDVGLAKLCQRMEIPRPPRGYWRQLEVGKAPRKPTLSKLSPHGVATAEIRATPARPSLDVPPATAIPVPAELKDAHRFTERTLSALRKGKPDEIGILESTNKQWLDVRVSAQLMDRACLIMDTLIKALESLGRDVAAIKDGQRKTVVRVGEEELQFSIAEKIVRSDHIPTKEERLKYGNYYWQIPKYDYSLTGKLLLRIENGPYGCRAQWSDGKRQRLEDCLGAFVQGLDIAAQRQKQLRVERQAQQQKWAEEARRREEARRLAWVEEQKADKLLKDVQAWKQAAAVRDYAAQLNALDPNDPELREWVEWVYGFADQIDPLNNRDTLTFLGSTRRT